MFVIEADSEQRINLLLIGGTGVGKSTWLNAFANYCSFETLHEAKECGGLFPVSYTCEVGESDTQTPSEYIFKYEQNTEINIIDTPGLLDTNDVGTGDHKKTKEHVSNILRLLSAYNKIHAICILVKANETRISDSNQYILTKILGRLDKRACNNIIFIFTYAEITNFKAQKTQPVLEKLLTNIFTENEVQIPLPPEKENIFCFDNGIVPYLAECKNKIPPDQDEEETAMRKWRKSRESAVNMI